MREVKFRGKEVGSGKWIYGYYVKDEEWAHEYIFNSQKQGIYYHLTKTQITPSTKGQYTGLKDKNREESFHKDIVSAEGYDNWIIEWHNNGWKLKQIGIENYIEIPEDFIIIGNEFENPELMEAK